MLLKIEKYEEYDNEGFKEWLVNTNPDYLFPSIQLEHALYSCGAVKRNLVFGVSPEIQSRSVC